ncbi:hypothetical protein F5Y05DRAFT_368191 [Hypoxylon sp. FL0543]|nr:hypothetical protein F5Y05DRAFT_368191 [Hypoxylon sp. FL0543]
MPSSDSGKSIQRKPALSARIVGLNKNQRPRSLLSKVSGRDNPLFESGPLNVKNQPHVSKMKKGGKLREPESIDAPPQSSDEEEDYRHSHDSDGDHDENGRVDIKPTNFKTAQSSLSQTNSARRSTRDKSKSSSQSHEPSSSASSKRSADESLPRISSSSHFTNPYGFSKKPKTTKHAATYGSKSSQPRSSQSKPSQKSAPRSSAKSPPRKTFKRFQTSSSPESARLPPAKQFVKPETVSPDVAGSTKAFKPPSSAESSPVRHRPTLRRGSLLSDTSPKKVKLKLFDVDEELGSPVEKKSTRQPTRTDKSNRSKARTRRGSPKPVPEEISQKPAFKLHTLDDLDYLDDSDDNAIALLENNISDDEPEDVSTESIAATTARCPMCHEVVDAELLAKHSDHGRMNIRKQTAFCRLHKRQTAISARSQRGYPKINWKTLNTRLEKHQDMLKDILEGTRPSYYREVLKENVDSGKNRTLLKTEDSLTPGYYGSRGLRAMTEYIMQTLSPIVRKRAVEDRLVSARGYTGYVQVVLVPELAVRLIMEDMNVAEEDARKIMQDSIEFGELLHEDAGDVIAGVSDEEVI